jgi:hypothetical protein
MFTKEEIRMSREDCFIYPEQKIGIKSYVEMQQIKYYDKNNWVKIFEFMAEDMFVLQSNLKEILPVLKEKLRK